MRTSAPRPAAGVNPANVIVSGSFTTQSVDTVLRVISGNGRRPARRLPPWCCPCPWRPLARSPDPQGPNLANLHVATITLPYYLSPPIAPPAGTGTEPLTNFWRAANPPPAAAGLQDPKNERNLTRFNPFPAVTTQLTVPMLIGIPRAPAIKPAAGWPVVIYQHGITRRSRHAGADRRRLRRRRFRHRRHRPAIARNHAE